MDTCGYNDSIENCNKYGSLHSVHKLANICPNGWRIPADSDISELITNISGTTNENGGKLLNRETLTRLKVDLGGLSISRGDKNLYFGKGQQEIWLVKSDSIWTDPNDSLIIKNLVGLHFYSIGNDSFNIEPSFSGTPNSVFGYCRCVKNNK